MTPISAAVSSSNASPAAARGNAAGSGPSSRSGILFRAGTRAFFVHGFAKNEQDNIRDDELAAFRMLADSLLNYDAAAIARVIANGTLTEVTNDDEAIS